MNDAKLFKLAKDGDLDAILDATDGDEDGDEDCDEEGDEDCDEEGDEGDQDAYKWLQFAADFGHKRARARADELLETTSLKYDDGGMVVGLIHLELGQAYLRGEAPLPVDHPKARFHLDIAKRAKIHKTTDVAGEFDAFRRKVGAEAREVFDAYFPAGSRKASAPAKKATKAGKPSAKKAAAKPPAKR